MQCSPANTNPGLTKPGAASIRRPCDQRIPDKIAYVRVATTDDLQGAGGADIAYNIAHAKNAYVADDTQTYGKGIADVFETTFTKLGGTVAKHDGIPDSTTDFTSYITALKGMTGLDYVYYGGVTTSGLGTLPQARWLTEPGQHPDGWRRRHRRRLRRDGELVPEHRRRGR